MSHTTVARDFVSHMNVTDPRMTAILQYIKLPKDIYRSNPDIEGNWSGFTDSTLLFPIT